MHAFGPFSVKAMRLSAARGGEWREMACHMRKNGIVIRLAYEYGEKWHAYLFL